jgi:hypothetical protein
MNRRTRVAAKILWAVKRTPEEEAARAQERVKNFRPTYRHPTPGFLKKLPQKDDSSTIHELAMFLQDPKRKPVVLVGPVSELEAISPTFKHMLAQVKQRAESDPNTVIQPDPRDPNELIIGTPEAVAKVTGVFQTYSQKPGHDLYNDHQYHNELGAALGYPEQARRWFLWRRYVKRDFPPPCHRAKVVRRDASKQSLHVRPPQIHRTTPYGNA